MQLRNYLLVLLVFSFLRGAPPLARAQQPANDPPSPGVPDAMYETQAMFGTFDAHPVNYEYDNSSELVNERLAALEAELSRLKLAEGGSSIAPGHSDSKMKITGRVHVDSWNFPEDSAGVNEIETEDPAWSPQDRFGFRRLRFGVRGTLPANMEYRIEMEFAGGNQSEFRDAWLGWNELPILQTLLVGNQKRPYGLDHLNSSRYNVFLERPFVIEAFNQDARRLGIASYGVSDNQRWNWRYGVYNQRLIQDEGNYVSDGLQLELAGRLANTIWYDETSGGRGYAHWALSGTWADPDGTGTTPPRATNEARFRTRPEARHDGTVDRHGDHRRHGRLCHVGCGRCYQRGAHATGGRVSEPVVRSSRGIRQSSPSAWRLFLCLLLPDWRAHALESQVRDPGA